MTQLHAKSAGHANRLMWTGVALATMLGAYVRLAQVSSADFPLNDGGLFYTMTQDLLRSRLALPWYISYNGLRLPFAYPPLPFYVAAIASLLTHATPLQVLRFLPALVSILTVPAFYLLSRELLQSPVHSLYATMAFALLPRSFLWMIMGGGLTRAPGFLFAILMLSAASRLYVERRARAALWVVLWGGLTVLCHPAGAWFAAFSAVLLWALRGRDRQALMLSLLAAAGVLVLTAPWWATLIARHGPATLLSALRTGGYAWFAWIRLLTFDFAEETFFGLLSTIGLLGAFLSLARHDWYLPAWLALIMMLDPRSGGTYAMVPLGMLVGIGLDQVVLPAVVRAEETVRGASSRNTGLGGAQRPQARGTSLVARAMLGFFLVHALLSALSVGVMRQSVLDALLQGERESMAWVADHTTASARFVLITGAPAWAADYVSEWFPALTGRASVATVQGYEWVPQGGFRKQIARSDALQDCAQRDVQCLQDWARDNQIDFTHVYVHEPRVKVGPGKTTTMVLPIQDSLLASADYRALFVGAGAIVFERRDTGR